MWWWLACVGSEPVVPSPTDAAPHADAGPSLYAEVGSIVQLDGSGSTNAVTYQWDLGNGMMAGPTADPVADVTFDEPGRYSVVLTATGIDGASDRDSVVVSVTHPVAHTPQHSTSLATVDGAIWVVSPDADLVAELAFDGTALSVVARHPTPAAPRTVAAWGDWIAVPCQEADAVALIGLRGASDWIVDLPRGSRPFGSVGIDDALLVTLQGTGEVARIEIVGGVPQVVDRFGGLPDARGITVLPDGRIAVTRWRSPDPRAEIRVLSAAGGIPEIWTLAYDPQAGSDTESGGVPSYLHQILVDPTGRVAVVPSLQANTPSEGGRAPAPLTHETTVRAVVSYLDPITGIEDVAGRKQFDDRGFASAGVFTSHGDFLYVAMRGSRSIDRIDVLTRGPSGSFIDVGLAPEGLALSDDDRTLFVDASLSRTVVAYDVSDLSAPPVPIAEVVVPEVEPLDPEILRGKQLFNDSFDTRIAQDGYIACAHCHLEGRDDGRTWDFTSRGEGLRNTISLLGRGGRTPIHWSANFDEVQDFEHDIRGAFGGTGLMDDADFSEGTRDQPLGESKAGISADLDALAAYVASLDMPMPSPFRDADGGLTPEAEAGLAWFTSPELGCTPCHAGPDLEDSAFVAPGVPRLHDVGTLTPASGQRLGGPLDGIDTPSLHGIWATAPYLHDGSAATLRDVLTNRNPDDAHGITSGLSPEALDELIAYLSSLDGTAD